MDTFKEVAGNAQIEGQVEGTQTFDDVTSRRIGDASGRDGLSTALFAQNPIAMLVYERPALRLIDVNDAACRLYGYDRERFLQQGLAALLTADAPFPEGESSERAHTHIKADGERIGVLTFEKAIRIDDRDCVLLSVIDVTEREAAAIELKSTRIFLNAVVESIPSMVFVKEALSGRFVLLNKAGEELLGVSRDDLIGKSDFDLFDPEDAGRFREADAAVVASGRLVTIENEPLTTPTGTRCLRTQKVGVPDADGKPRYLLGISEDVTEKLRVEERSRHLSLHDVLTDLPNRLQFQTLLEQKMGTTADFALLLLDLDRFKAVNDNFGHHIGDELLRQVSQRMTAIKGEQDVVARLGGDEFGILHCGEINANTASRLASELVGALCEPFTIEGHRVSIGSSAGIVLNSRHGGTADALMKRADLALYAAKETGKGDYAWFEMEMEEKADRKRMLRNELSAALDNGQLYLEYQPIVCAATAKILCFEALLRWQHPTRGPISPAEFIPVAEASGLIEPIGRRVLLAACREAASWPDNIRVAVNLSPRQFTGFGLAADVTRALEQSGLHPGRLELEITESIFLHDNQENVRILHQLKALGVAIALDDFGTGYSSLAYLRCFPFDKLKIDRSFIHDMTSSPENMAIVRAVIGLGKSFNAIVTAEGVETQAQFTALAGEGCDQLQGYLFGRPMPTTGIIDALNRSAPVRSCRRLAF